MTLGTRSRHRIARTHHTLASPLLFAACASLACAPSATSATLAPPGTNASEPAPAQSAAGPAPESAPNASNAAMRPSEAALRRLIASLQRGEPVTDQAVPDLARAVQGPPFQLDVVNLGEVESITFEATNARGFDVYHVRSKTGFSEWSIQLGPDGKTSGLFLRVLDKPPEKPLTQAEFAKELEARLLAEATKDEFSGVVLVARDGKPIYQRAIGLADREQGIPNQLQTKFRIGSMNKMFTAVAILQLVQAGKLALSDPLGKYLKDYPNAELAQHVTIEHLLTHTGGTGDIFGPEYEQRKNELRKLEDYVKLHGARGVAFPPGTQWAYSNYGFVLLGVVIEKVTGKSYYDYVAQHVYAPAGMKNTGSFAEDQNVPLRSIGYMRFRPPGAPASPGAKWFSNATTLPYRGTSAGGGYSTAADLLAFANALEQHRLLDAEHTAQLITPKPGPAAEANYVYGFANQTLLGVSCHGHDGGAPGINGQMMICQPPGTQSSFVVITLANLDPPIAGRLGEFARTRLPAATEATASTAGCSDLSFDDLEDGDERSSGSPGASGSWGSYKDVNGTSMSPEPFALAAGGASGSKHAVHITGKLGPSFPAWAGISLEAAGGNTYDLSPWARVCFRVKGSGRARFDVTDVNTSPAGGVCQQCYNNFGVSLSLTPSWQEHCVAFDEMTQAGRWGAPLSEVVEEKAYSISWSMHSPGEDYDLWVDDVRLVCH